MRHYVVEVQTTEHKPSPDRAEELMSTLADYQPVVGTTVGRHVQITITVPATSLGQAVHTALAVIERCATPSAITAVPEQDREAHQRWVELPELVGVTEAGTILGISRQAVLGLVDRGQLPGRHVTTKIVAIPAASVHARKAREAKNPPATGRAR